MGLQGARATGGKRGDEVGTARQAMVGTLASTPKGMQVMSAFSPRMA